MNSFELTLGDAKPCNKQPLRHEDDFACELLVDFSDSNREGLSLGFISAMKDISTGETKLWVLFDENGDNLPGLPLTFESKAGAMKAATDLVARIVGDV